MTAPLGHPRLITGAVPSKLPGCPRYLSKSAVQFREEPESKRLRLECAMIEEAIVQSRETERIYQEKTLFCTIEELFAKAENIELGDWIIRKEESLYFFNIEVTPYPFIKCSVCVTTDLELSILCGDVNLKSLCDYKFPMKVNNINQIEEILKAASMKVETRKNETKSLQENSFLQEQIHLSNTVNKNRLRYSWETILFCGLVHSISPHAYKFLRNSGNLILPSSSTIKRVCGKFSTSPHLEQDDATFLHYARSKYKLLNAEDKLIILMLDEIHIKPYMDYKGGNLVGNAYNTTECASSAHTFMVNSLLSPYKDVVHILPVKTLEAPDLHYFIKKVILGLEDIGFTVLAVATDNNAINKKAMSFFSDPSQVLNVYEHPSDSSRPLFFAIDSVHIFKCLLSNWLNKTPNPYMKFPDFENETMRLASFNALREMHREEKQELLKYGYNLTLKALYPTSIERQNVKLATQIFNCNIVSALETLGPKKHFESFQDTAIYIGIICKWWNVVNVKTLLKGKRLRNDFQEPITKSSHHIWNFLNDFLKWLNRWESCDKDGRLTKETHFALKHTTETLIKMAKYCLDQKGFNFFLCGKVQTDKLEERFGKYRQQAGAQYHVSVRQVFEAEGKMRIQSMLPLILESNKFGNLQFSAANILQFIEPVETQLTFENRDRIPEILRRSCVVYEDISGIKDDTWPLLAYIAGYASYSAIKKFTCDYCKQFLTAEDQFNANSEFITSNNRGSLCYPSEDVVTCAAYSYLVIQRLLSSDNESIFLKETNQRQTAAILIYMSLNESEYQFFAGYNCAQHSVEDIIKKILLTFTNILLNNYTKKQNDIVKVKNNMPQIKRLKSKQIVKK